ncbi:MAG: 4-hydroxy-tetrahydrodipicolinate synthase [Coxiella sp. (in: Bacteria)]|nr:MAG: 4-hydroxy-tetrahydrodipicolinate synthase [Coxiella sp. (in: g-proteobacteria)]
MFQGSMVALVTPMTSQGAVDYGAFERLIEWHLECQTDGFVILGTTAESPTITADERLKIIQASLRLLKGKAPVIVGTGTNCTQSTIALTRQAYDLGADGALLISPYYNKPTQEGLYLHHKAVAEAVPLPQILYNNPSRTACDLLPETVIRLSKFDTIVALKETVNDVVRFRRIVAEADLDLLGGSDGDALALMQAGGKGIISVAANVIPRAFRQFCQAALSGNDERAQQLQTQLAPLFEALFVEANPIPTKWALHELGKIDNGIRLPLTWLSKQQQAVVKQAMIDEEKTCVL